MSRRLADMAEVERIARDRVPRNAGQRLRRIAAALDHGLSARVDRIVLHNDRAEFPAAWRHVLERFDVTAEPGPTGEAAEASDLGRIPSICLKFATSRVKSRRLRRGALQVQCLAATNFTNLHQPAESESLLLFSANLRKRI
jgi:hypothetical protein